ncbi:unnamed protein product [Somion occarium]|uniref:Uncharacterized protein n=1 Tax=Somion occarium TaxID=3059160 RepID=A0ABP1E1T8_9APHY
MKYRRDLMLFLPITTRKSPIGLAGKRQIDTVLANIFILSIWNGFHKKTLDPRIPREGYRASSVPYSFYISLCPFKHIRMSL